jgi:hypothetical protein
LLLTKVFGADVIRCEKAQEGSAAGSGFNGGSTISLFAFDDADDSCYGHACFASCFNGVDG